MKKYCGLTLIEMMVVVAIFSILFIAVFTVLFTSNTSWRVGYNKTIEQQEARRAIDSIGMLIRQTKPSWVTISSDVDGNHDKILFYEPDFNNTVYNNTTGVTTVMPGDWVIYKTNTSDTRELMMKGEGDADWTIITQHMTKIKFNGGSCAGCNCNFANSACLSCMAATNATSKCPLIRVEINSTREKGFSLVSYLGLRNDDYNATVTNPSPPEEGEF